MGGTWSSYRRDYQEWFVKRCLDAMNDVEAETLAEAQEINASGKRRNVGLVVETRQDRVTVEELRWLRYLGVTKVQVGIQSLDDRILELNKRGHDVQATRDAFRLLRLAGFKIHGHWMANLLGATPESDVADYGRLWSDPAIRPDELKLYPCMLVENAELYEYWQRGEYQPYSEDEVRDVLVECMSADAALGAPQSRHPRLPDDERRRGQQESQYAPDRPAGDAPPGYGRCRIFVIARFAASSVRREDLTLRVDTYDTDATTEHFLSFETADERIAGFLRLSLPEPKHRTAVQRTGRPCHDPRGACLWPGAGPGRGTARARRSIWVWAQNWSHQAKEMAREAGYERLAVISAIGTREYYAKLDFALDGLYMTTSLRP